MKEKCFSLKLKHTFLGLLNTSVFEMAYTLWIEKEKNSSESLTVGLQLFYASDKRTKYHVKYTAA